MKIRSCTLLLYGGWIFPQISNKGHTRVQVPEVRMAASLASQFRTSAKLLGRQHSTQGCNWDAESMPALFSDYVIDNVCQLSHARRVPDP